MNITFVKELAQFKKNAPVPLFEVKTSGIVTSSLVAVPDHSSTNENCYRFYHLEKN